MSRLYSQRNRDKLKKQIEELQAWQAQLELEQDELLETRKNYKRRLADTEMENEALRQKLIEHKENDVRLLEERNLVHRQQLREELLLSPGSSLPGQVVPRDTVGSGGMLRGVDIGIGSAVGSLHQPALPPVYGGMNPAALLRPQQFVSAAVNSFSSVAPSLPQYCPPNLLRPSPAIMSGTSLPNETTMTNQSQLQPNLPVFFGDAGTMAAVRQQHMRSRGICLDRATNDEKGRHSTSRSRKGSKNKRPK
jgi:hypothetical protein